MIFRSRLAFVVVALLGASIFASTATAAPSPPGPASRAVAAGREAHLYRPSAKDTDALPPRRIVSLAPVITEAIFAVGAGDRLVGVTQHCDRPAAAKALPKVGGFTTANVERILALRPDLVIAMPSLGQRDVLDRLRERGVRVGVAFGDTIAEVRSLLQAVGTWTNNAAIGNAAALLFDTSLSELWRLPLSKPRVLIVVNARPIVVAGGGTFPNEALVLVNAIPVVAPKSPAWPTWSLEAVLAAKPDIVVAAGGLAAREALAAQLSRVPGGPVVVSADHTILMRPGPHLAEDVKTLAELIDSATPPAVKK